MGENLTPICRERLNDAWLKGCMSNVVDGEDSSMMMFWGEVCCLSLLMMRVSVCMELVIGVPCLVSFVPTFRPMMEFV